MQRGSVGAQTGTAQDDDIRPIFIAERCPDARDPLHHIRGDKLDYRHVERAVACKPALQLQGFEISAVPDNRRGPERYDAETLTETERRQVGGLSDAGNRQRVAARTRPMPGSEKQLITMASARALLTASRRRGITSDT